MVGTVDIQHAWNHRLNKGGTMSKSKNKNNILVDCGGSSFAFTPLIQSIK